jgi:hypothetical protein
MQGLKRVFNSTYSAHFETSLSKERFKLTLFQKTAFAMPGFF